MKRLLAVIMLTALAGCSFAKLSIVEYNNRIVTVLNEISDDIQLSVEQYDAQIPTTVNEKSEIDPAPMETVLGEMRTHSSELENLTQLQSKDESQQTAVADALSKYTQANAAYVQAYEGTVNYYANKGYQEDVEQVKVVDETLHKTYNDLVEAHNHLVEVLNSYIQ